MNKLKSFACDIIDINTGATKSVLDAFAKFAGTENNTYTEDAKIFLGTVSEYAKQVAEGTWYPGCKE